MLGTILVATIVHDCSCFALPKEKNQFASKPAKALPVSPNPPLLPEIKLQAPLDFSKPVNKPIDKPLPPIPLSEKPLPLPPAEELSTTPKNLKKATCIGKLKECFKGKK